MFSSSLAALLRLLSNILDILACSCLEVRQLRTCLSPLSRHPLTYISRTVPEFCSVGFADGKEFHSFVIRESDLLEIDSDSTLFPSE